MIYILAFIGISLLIEAEILLVIFIKMLHNSYIKEKKEDEKDNH